MNIYARYFDEEKLTHSLDELVDFLKSISEINVTPQMLNDIAAYVQGDMPYPRRFKVHTRAYFILIKTQAETMDEFKNRNAGSAEEAEKKSDAIRSMHEFLGDGMNGTASYSGRDYDEVCEGWYRVNALLKRVVKDPDTQRCSYVDAPFEALVKGKTPRESYNRVIDYFRSRPDIDPRSQMPSIKGANFSYEYLGETLREE